MKQYIVRQTLMISETQAESLATLKTYKVNISQFIRQAIREKIIKDWRLIKAKRKEPDCPF